MSMPMTQPASPTSPDAMYTSLPVPQTQVENGSAFQQRRPATVEPFQYFVGDKRDDFLYVVALTAPATAGTCFQVGGALQFPAVVFFSCFR